MELWVFDRSGPYSPRPFDIHREPEKLIRAIIRYTLMSDEKLGLDDLLSGMGMTLHRRHGKRSENQILLEQQPIAYAERLSVGNNLLPPKRPEA